MTNANGQAGAGAARPEAPKLSQAALILLGQPPLRIAVRAWNALTAEPDRLRSLCAYPYLDRVRT